MPAILEIFRLVPHTTHADPLRSHPPKLFVLPPKPHRAPSSQSAPSLPATPVLAKASLALPTLRRVPPPQIPPTSSPVNTSLLSELSDPATMPLSQTPTPSSSSSSSPSLTPTLLPPCPELEILKFCLRLPFAPSKPSASQTCVLCHRRLNPTWCLRGAETSVELPCGCLVGHMCAWRWFRLEDKARKDCPICGVELLGPEGMIGVEKGEGKAEAARRDEGGLGVAKVDDGGSGGDVKQSELESSEEDWNDVSSSSKAIYEGKEGDICTEETGRTEISGSESGSNEYHDALTEISRAAPASRSRLRGKRSRNFSRAMDRVINIFA